MISPSLSYAEYEALPGLRWSTLRHMGDSPRHCRHAERADGDTASRVLLRAIHAGVLEGRRDYIVYEGGDRKGKDWNLFKACYPGQTILKPNEAAKMEATVSAIRSHPVAARLLSEGQPEVSVTWGDFKARIDWLGSRYIVDLKTLGTTETGSVARMVALRQHHGQMAHYLDGLRAHGKVIDRAYLIVAEGDDAQDVAVFDLDDRALDVGLRLRDQYAARYRDCVASGEWPGRHPEIAPLGLPEWAVPQEGADNG